MPFNTTDAIYEILESKDYAKFYKITDLHSKKLVNIARFEYHTYPLTNRLQVCLDELAKSRPSHMTEQDDLKNIKVIAKKVQQVREISKRIVKFDNIKTKEIIDKYEKSIPKFFAHLFEEDGITPKNKKEPTDRPYFIPSEITTTHAN